MAAYSLSHLHLANDVYKTATKAIDSIHSHMVFVGPIFLRNARLARSTRFAGLVSFARYAGSIASLAWPATIRVLATHQDILLELSLFIALPAKKIKSEVVPKPS